MSAMTPDQLWQRLRERALVDGEMPRRSVSPSPWYVRTMLGIAGWIGAGFLLAFVGVGFAFVMQSAAAALAVGALCCAAAYAVFHAARDNDFATQFGLALSLAGQGVFAAGVFNAFKSNTAAAYLLIAAFEAALALLLPNVIHRVLTGAAAAIALTCAMSRYGIESIAPALAAAGFTLIWLQPRRWAAGDLWRPLGYGLALALLLIEAIGQFGWRRMAMPPGEYGRLAEYGPWLAAILTGVVFVWSVVRLLENERIALAGRVGMAAIGAAALVGVLSFWAPGVASALLILLLGFACGNRILLGLGLIGLLGFVSHYYYALQATLLMKSAVLAATGVALLAARLVMHRLFPADAQTEDHHA